MANEKTKALADKLFYKKKSVFETKSADDLKKMQNFAEGYKAWLDASKTEREAVCEMIKILDAEGFTEYKLGDSVKAGDKLYYNNRGKSLSPSPWEVSLSRTACVSAHPISTHRDLT